ncbi:MAG TPA: hypothetical protein VHM30_19995 [Gemmatimonadaceae bacterium]|nr:hypothetical protein [Gemmatimonadaceae bacterium]
MSQQPQRSEPTRGEDSSSPRSAAASAANAASAHPEPDERIVLIDGSNVAHSSEGEKPRLANILIVADKMREEGMEPIIVADAALRHQIDDRGAYEKLVDDGKIKQAPSGTDADYFILSFARELGASVLSNDRYRDRIAKYPEVEERIIRYMIVADEVVLERRTKRRRD